MEHCFYLINSNRPVLIFRFHLFHHLPTSAFSFILTCKIPILYGFQILRWHYIYSTFSLPHTTTASISQLSLGPLYLWCTIFIWIITRFSKWECITCLINSGTTSHDPLFLFFLLLDRFLMLLQRFFELVHE